MIKNYFKIAWRTILRHRAFSAINVAGLAIGIASCLLMSLYVLDELSYDRFNEKADRIVRVVFKGNTNGGKINESHVMPPVAHALKNDFPEILAATRLRRAGMTALVGEKKFRDERTAFADSNFFQVFTLPLLKGNPATALVEPNSVVLSKRTAEKFFGTIDAVGKTFKIKDSDATYKVTGVMENIPTHTHFQFDVFLSMSTFPDSRSDSWMMSEFFTYLVLPENYNYKTLEAKLPATVDKYMGPQVEKSMGVSMAELRKSGNDLGLYLQPLTDIHLHSDFTYDLSAPGDVRYVYIFGAVAVLMLLIACINFMNLSTAGASKRAREVGVRKVMGSEKSELVWQFLLESGVLTGVALVLGIVFCILALPLFNELSGKTLHIGLASLPVLIPVLVVFGVFVGLLAGGYPAFFLASFKPITVLKGKFSSGRQRFSLRSTLVVVQFFVSITLIIGTTVVYQQLRYIQNKKLGYNKDQVLVLPDTWALNKNQETFRNELKRDPAIVSVTASGYVPAGSSYNNNYMVSPEDNSSQMIHTLRYDVDAAYIPTMGMEIIAGRNFSDNFGNDSSGVILNETAAKTLGWNQHAIDKVISNRDNAGKKTTYRVIGVVRDFHFRSLREKIAPLVMVLGPGAGTTIAKVNTRDVTTTIARVKKLYESFGPEQPFSFSFLDQRFEDTYKTEQKIGQILGIFAGLTIFVACLGLFGLATFTAEQRIKEIGVRKVLGASVTGIVALLSKDFLKLVGIGQVASVPVAWYAMDRWLRDFEYRIELPWWTFVLAGLLAAFVAILTVSYQSVKAALTNPVQSLRSE